MTNAQLQTELSTPEGFSRRVVVPQTAKAVARVLLILAGVGVAYNLISTLRTISENPGAGFLDVFLSTEGDNGLSSIWFTLLVWGPIILLPLALVFFLYARATSDRAANSTYLAFSGKGHVAAQRPTGFTAIQGSGNSTVAIKTVLVGSPSVKPEAYDKAIAAIAAHVASLDKKASKALAKSIGAALKSGPVPATQLASEAPAELLVMAPVGKSEWVAVIPAAEGSKARYFGVKP